MPQLRVGAPLGCWVSRGVRDVATAWALVTITVADVGATTVTARVVVESQPLAPTSQARSVDAFDRAGLEWSPVLIAVPQGHRVTAVRATDGSGEPVRAEGLGTSGLAGYQIALVRVERPAAGSDESAVAIEVETAPGAEPVVQRLRNDSEQATRIRRRLRTQVANPEALPSFAPPAPQRRPERLAAAARERGFRPTAEPSLDGSGVRYLIVTTEALQAAFEPLASWKTRRGIPTQIRTIEWIEARTRRGIDRAETLRNFLVEAYALWGVEWVLLGGDTGFLPARFGWSALYGGGTSPTEMYFACLDGTWNGDGDAVWGEGSQTLSPGESDMLPELGVARAPVNSTSEAQVFVQRVIAYEKPLFTDYQHKALFLGEVLIPANWDSGMTVSYNGAPGSEQMIASLPPGMQVDRLYDTNWLYPGSTKLSKQATISRMNAGPGIVNHLGHGFRYTMSLGDASLVNADADNLSNGSRPFVLCMANCAAVAYDYNCLAERFLLNPGGGAAGVIGAARSVSATLIVTYNRAFHRQLFEYGKVHLAELLNELRLERAALAELDGSDRWIQFSLNALGDPEMPIFTGPARLAALAHADSVGMGADTLVVDVTADSLPVAGAQLCAFKDGEVYAVGFTDSLGRAHLEISPETTGELYLTVSGRNLAAHTDTLNVGFAAGDAVLVLESAVLDDDSNGASSGNGNGALDAGEQIELALEIRNRGGAATDGARGMLVSLDPRLVVLQGEFEVDAIGAGGVGAATAMIVLYADAGVPDGTVFEARIDLNDGQGGIWSDRLRLQVCAPRPEVTRVRSVSPPPTATAAYEIEIRNYGGGEQPPVTATLVALDSAAVVVEGTIAFGAVASLAFGIGSPAAAVDDSTNAGLELTLQDTYGRTSTHRFDRVPPDPPAAPAADLAAAAGTVHLTWPQSHDADLYGYHVFRLSPGNTEFVRLTPDAILHSDFYDTTVLSNTSYRYHTVAVDSSRQWSAPSDTVDVSTTAALLPGFPLDLSDPTATSVAVGDLDGDNEPEIVVGDNGIFAWRSNGEEVVDGDSNSSTFGVFSSATGTMNASVALADVDGALGLEVIGASWFTNRIYVWKGNGQVLPGWPREPASGGNTGYWGSPAVADLDGDGSPEIAIVSKDGWLYVWHADGTPLLPATNGAVRQVGAWTQTTPALVDLDGDGAKEIIVACATASVYVLRTDGSDFPGWPYALFSLGKSSPAVADLDGDGDLEIVVTSESDHLWVFNHDGTLVPGWPKSVPMDAPDFGPSVALGDLDGNGTAEIVVVSVKSPFPSTKLRVYDFAGNILFEKPLELNSQSSPILADLDGDGGIDILHGGEAGVMHAWNFAGQELSGFPIPLGDYARGTPAYCDLDLDGHGDIVFAGWNKKVYVWRMAGPYRPDRAPWPTFHGNMQRTGYLRPEFPTPAGEVRPPARLGATWNPNPFNPSVAMRLELPGAHPTPVRVDVFDARGRRVRRLVDVVLPPGVHRCSWDGRDDAGRALPSGIYLYRVQTGDVALSGKLTLIR